ncbi:MAG: DUF4126 family protein [Mycobacterium sp.]|uniref:DUF4126 family protein n=1 Tax=Mycobacterium sp. TaxID=1785 RepID=UPI002602CDAC|nr:DUF4126 family protein [Mycobacterium sp.]MDI3313888.1 DUF4126 family protein [Mycobacterium sp.]
MTHTLVVLLALLIGVVAGLRALTALAAVSWATGLHWINLDGTWASWVGQPVPLTVLTVLAIVELAADKHPKIPSRTTAVAFSGRIILGAVAGAAIGTAWNYTWSALGSGVIGAVLGTMGGLQARVRLAARAGHDLPVALAEDAIAVLGGFAIAAVTAAL